MNIFHVGLKIKTTDDLATVAELIKSIMITEYKYKFEDVEIQHIGKEVISEEISTD